MRHAAAFDLDGTLARRDTVLPFLARVAGSRAVAAALCAEWQALWQMRRGGDPRDAAKTAVLARVLAGRRLEDLRVVGERFADELVASRLRPDVLGRLRWHRSQGHAAVLVTASLDLYAVPLAARLGIDVLSTGLATDDAGVCTGALDGANCRGEEKVRRLRAWLGDEPATLWAYGNSSDDAAMLAMADVAVWVGRRPVPRVPPRPPTTNSA